MTNMYEIYPKVLLAIDAISAGATISRACAEVGTTVQTFRKYVEHTPELQEALKVAEQQGYDALADALLDIDIHERYGSSDPKVMKIKSDNIKWLLSKRDEKRFGQKVAVDVTLRADKVITTALDRARGRTALPAPAGEIIDATFTEVVDPEPARIDEDIAALF